MRFPAMRGINRLRFAIEEGLGRAMARSRAKLLRRDLRLLGKHHGNVIANRIHPAARFALQTALVRLQVHARFAHRAAQNVEQFLGNSHLSLAGNFVSRFECNRRVPSPATHVRVTAPLLREIRAPRSAHPAGPRPLPRSCAASLRRKFFPPDRPAPRATPDFPRALCDAQSAPRHTAESNVDRRSAAPGAARRSIHPSNSRPRCPPDAASVRGKANRDPSRAAFPQISIRTSCSSPRSHPAVQEIRSPPPRATLAPSAQGPTCFSNAIAPHRPTAPPSQTYFQNPAAR